MAVIIGVDPHKATHTAVAISGGEEELGRRKVRAGGAQAEQLVAWAEPFRARTWAIESAGGLGYLLAQQLVAAGETVVRVPPKLMANVRDSARTLLRKATMYGSATTSSEYSCSPQRPCTIAAAQE